MTRRVRFTKMQGLGNDFVVIDAVSQSISLAAPEIRRIADRHFGVGCDQVLVVEKASQPGIDFGYRIFNADGGEVEQCGNGARCFVQFVRAHGLTTKRAIRVQTRGGVIEPALEADGQVSVDMGEPRFAARDIPFVTDSDDVVQLLQIAERGVPISALSMGNPHAVQVVADVDAAPVRSEGPHIERHPRFPNGANAGYMQIVDRANIRLRVWERGAGETLACGTGACAAVVAGIRRGLLDSRVRVSTRGGMLTIAWGGAGAPVFMTGPAETVFEGEWALDEAPPMNDARKN
ncbi:MAG: diaminopimelate epimerase [Betaproteobacteria bacterium]